MPGKLYRLFSRNFFRWAIICILLSLPVLNLTACCPLDVETKSFACKYPLKQQSAATASPADIGSQSKWPHTKSDLLPDPAVLYASLPNGFRYVLLENHTPKHRVSAHLNVQAGSMHETDEQKGMAHFLEHMLFCGSEHFKPGELVKYFQTIGMQFGPDANAHTGFYETVYDLLLPDGSRESIEKGLLVMKDYAEGALLLESEINRERKIVLAEKRTRDSASYRTFVSTMKFEFPDARISERLPIGSEEIIKNADQTSLKDFYDTWYRPETMILVMVGDFDSKLAARLIAEKFASLSARAPPQPDPDFGKIDHQGIKAFNHFEKETGHTTVSIEVAQRIMPKPDSLALQKEMLIRDIANRIVQNRLEAVVGKPDTPFTSASISAGIYLHQIASADITAESRPDNWKKTLSRIEQTLRKALTYGFTNSELERVKKDFLSELDNAVKETSTRKSEILARQIISNLNDDRVFLSPRQKKELFSQLIHSLTADMAHDVFKDTWSPEHRLVLVTGNARLCQDDTRPEDRILSVFNKSTGIEVLRPVATKPVVFPYLPEPEKKREVIHRTEISDLGIVQVDFKNGVRLNLKKTDFKANEVLVNLAFGYGKSSEPPNRPGLAALSSAVINESGLGALNKDEIERALAGKNTNVSFSVDEHSFFFKGQTVSQEILLLFQLLYAHLTDPGYREDAYILATERFRQEYLTLSHSIEGAMELSGKRFFAGGDSRFGLPPYNAFKKLSLDNVRSWIEASLKHDSFEMSVVGDFDIDSIIEIASRYLGGLSLSPTGRSEKKSGLITFPAGKSIEIGVATEIPKGLVIVAYPTEDLWNINRTRRLSVLADVLSERLRERIREKLGAAYSLFAFNQPSRAYPGYGVLKAFVEVKPAEAVMVKKEVKQIIANIIKNGVTQDELRRALEPTLTSIKDMLRTNNYWLNTVLSGSKKYPQQLDWNRTIMRDYASITTEELSVLAKKYLDNNKATTIIIKPSQKK